MTSSPAESLRSPSEGEVRHDRAARLAEDPELTSEAQRTPMKSANSRSNCAAKRPVVSHASSDASTRSSSSVLSKTFPDTGTLLRPGTNVGGARATRKYCLTIARISSRSWPAVLGAAFVIAELSPARMGHRGGCAQEFAVPGEGAIKAGVESELWLPVEHGARTLGTQELMTNFIARLVEHIRS